MVDSFDPEVPVLLPSLPDGPRARLSELAARVLGTGAAVHVGDARGSGPALVAHALALSGAAHVVYVAPDADGAQRALGDLKALAHGLPLGPELSPASSPDAAPLVFSASETSPYAEVHADRRAGMARAAALFHAARGLPWRFAVVTAAALLRRVADPRSVKDAGVRIEVEGELDVSLLAKRLTAAGYLRAPLVEDPGTFAVRGGVVDVWPAQRELPLRIELYGDLVLTMRDFDPDDQRTGAAREGLWIPPAREVVIDEATEVRARVELRALCDAVDYPSTKARQFIDDVSSGRAYFGIDGFLPAFQASVPLLDYFADAAFVVEDPAALLRAFEEETALGRAGESARQGAPHFELSRLYCEPEDVARALLERPTCLVHHGAVAGPCGGTALAMLEAAPEDVPGLVVRGHADLDLALKAARSRHGKAAGLEPLLERIAAWHEAGLRVVITARTETQAGRVRALLGHRGVATDDGAGAIALASDQVVHVVVAPLSRGALAIQEGFVLVTEEEIFGQRTHRSSSRKRGTRAVLEDLRALTPGDAVVHVDHGVGRYLGLERRTVNGVGVDLLVVEYGGGDKLYLPVHRLSQIQKYSGGESSPKLDRLGGQTFSRTKAKVAQRVRQMADELLKLYAERAAQKKQPLPPPDDDYAAFEAGFPYEETRDQAAAISEVTSDLTSDRVMDRLVCGDVGFGKTEVALRAAFLCANAGGQVALLCPTTVLAQQHFLTFQARLENYALRVGIMSRFQSKAQEIETLKRLKDGTLDIVVGTHRLLSKDVHFKRLGLLVVDEEQRFGVTHKERIKQIRASVDVLTLSATPIPRTLQLAVGGLRDMSLITTPPVDRRAIRTVTSQFDQELVRQAIERELERGGQVFYVYNRVEGIYERAARVEELVPRARVAVGHGQMSEASLERTMFEFVKGDFDVLVTTAIIESGLDIPRANTIIVDRADLFGLSQLYQLRGRVGRGSERAYCYLLVPPPSQLTEEARLRLEALERHTELGSGFQIATLDMELRGAGDLLGAEQSGYVDGVGFELFCRMLEEATHELRGETVVHEVDPELSFDVEALLPEDYVGEIGVRLSFYKRLASASDEAEVQELASELEDRFGAPPIEARRFLELTRLKTELRRLRVLGCEASAKSVSLHLRDDTPLDPASIGRLVAQKRSPYRLTPEGRLTRRALENETFSDGLALADRVLGELAECVRVAEAS